jgi:hypothetical protein
MFRRLEGDGAGVSSAAATPQLDCVGAPQLYRRDEAFAKTNLRGARYTIKQRPPDKFADGSNRQRRARDLCSWIRKARVYDVRTI